MSNFVTLIEPLELTGSRVLRIAVAFAALCGATGLLAFLWWLYKQSPRERILPYPVVGDPHAQSLEENLIEGMQQYRHSPFVLAGSRPPLLILPMSVFHEIHNMPNEYISVIAEHEDKFQGKYTHITTVRPEIPATIRQDLTRNMPSIILELQDELAYASQQWPRTSNWTSVSLYEMMLRTVALLSGRAFVGLPLCRDQGWLQASIGYTVHCVSIRDQLHTWSPVLRPIIGPFLPSVRSVRRHLRFAAEIMAPLISHVLQEDENQHRADAPLADQTKERGTFISWLLRHLPEELRTPEQVGLDQMLVSFAAIHTTTMALTKVVWELVKRPEYIEPLRAEIHDVFGPDAGAVDICVNKEALSRLHKLDSFIREVQRWCPSSFVTPSRRVMKSMTLSNGIKLQKGTSIAFPAHAIHMSEETPTFSPSFSSDFTNPSPLIFDGFRYSNLRSVKGQESQHQAATTGPDYLIFNHGKHACPGRFFAICEIKMILIELLAKYDFRLADGEPGPELFRTGTETRLDTKACLEIRRG
ncbi:gibberellin cluster-C13-oxidase [Fusarium mangiferae]|uniref:Gibberellin cluster-C13-oxidase n=1 Tax=Fusarium mangiferae TaxID=192010 RepID=A0A1L7U3V0_FUSMA|nr:gibberellin cluster-C13-oxidase [Fusarium mangiferae]CVL02151.1 gibberellin cluster-C13-oxidase [Fusarium mangiferae]